MFQCLPEDPKIMKMDEVVKNWMFFSWVEDKNEQSILLRNQSCLIGSFWNPKAAKEVLGIGDSRKVSVSDDDFEKAFDFVQKGPEEKENVSKKLRKKRKKLVFNGKQ